MPRCLVGVILTLLATVPSAQAPNVLVITQVNVLDVVSVTFLADRTITIINDRITHVAPVSEAIPPGARVVNGDGQYLVPGLWDMHTHLSYGRKSVLPALVAHGVTYVRDLGSRLAEIDQWRGEIASGQIAGP